MTRSLLFSLIAVGALAALAFAAPVAALFAGPIERFALATPRLVDLVFAVPLALAAAAFLVMVTREFGRPIAAAFSQLAWPAPQTGEPQPQASA